jgi:hypothetical protein
LNFIRGDDDDDDDDQSTRGLGFKVIPEKNVHDSALAHNLFQYEL